MTKEARIYSGKKIASSVNIVGKMDSQSVQSLSRVWLSVTAWIAARQASVSITNYWSYSDSRPSSQCGHPAISSSVVPFISRLQSFPASGSFLMSQLLASRGQSTRASASASVLPVTIEDCFPLGLTSWISLQFKGLWRVFNTTVQKHQFFSAQLSSQSNSHIHTWPQEKL